MEGNLPIRKGKRGSNPRFPYRGRNISEHGFPQSPVISQAAARRDSGGTRIPREQYLSDLFREQSRLTKSISRQGALARLDPRMIISVEKEMMRQVTNEIIRVSADMAQLIAPGQYNRSGDTRVVMPDQIIFDQMYSKQGVRHLGGDPGVLVKNQPLAIPSKRRNGKGVVRVNSHDSRLQLFQLEGPALKLYLKAVNRGYLGGPQRWLRSRYCRQALPALRSKGLIGPVEQKHFGVFDPKSPLRFCLRQNTNLQSTLTKGFFGESIVQYGDISVLSRQKGQRLEAKHWPSIQDKKIWPSTPTLFESWQASVSGATPERHFADNTVKNSTTLRQLRENPELAKRVARANVLGIRAWIPLPEKLRWYFKYRWGFLILRRKVPLSIGVASFLLSLWKRAPNQCFLLDRVSIRYYLMNRMPTRFVTETAHADARLRTFLGAASEGLRDPADTIRPTRPLRFVLQSSKDLRHLEKDTGGVRLTDSQSYWVSPMC